MRKQLWLTFHLWTFGLVVVLAIANIASVWRPYRLPAHRTGAAHSRVPASSVDVTRINAAGTKRGNASSSPDESSTSLLAVTRIGCESQLQVEIPKDLKQLRLKFDPCGQDGDVVVGVTNITNGFEGTVFGANPGPEILKPEPSEGPIGAGVFVPAGVPSRAPESRSTASARNLAVRKVPQEPLKLSSDYISLSPGDNKIGVRRLGRAQTIQVRRQP